jgi:gentisate 1,2-dioxygenase
MIISSESYRRLASRAPATIQGGRAQYLPAEQSAVVGTPKLSVHVFSDEAARAFDAAAQTGTIDFDRSSTLGGGYPATTSNLLVRYLVIRGGEEFEFAAQATSVLCYVINGSGRSFQEDEVIEWDNGDAFLFPGGEAILHEARDGDAVLFVVTDEPFVSMMGCTVAPVERARVKSTHYVGKTVAARLEDTAAGLQQPSEHAILNFVSAPFERNGCVAPMMAAGIATLAPGASQPEHCHDSDTISLPLECDGGYALIEARRVDLITNTAILTPAGAAHSQHSASQSRVFSFFVQDRGPRPVRTWDSGPIQAGEADTGEQA